MNDAATDQRAIALLHALVATPGLSGQEGDVARLLTAQMARLGFAARIDAAGNAVGVRENPAADGHIHHETVLLGHIDTVPGVVPVRLTDGRLYGRGAVDAKGPLATFVMAAARATLPPGSRVVVIGAVEEESATSKGARYAATQYRPTWCVIGEPSGWDGVTLGYKGRLLIDYDLGLPVSHTAGPEISVAERAVTFWQQLQAYAAQFNQGRQRLFDQILPTLRHIRTDHDGLTETVTARISLRLPPDFDLADLTSRLQEWAEEATCHWHSHEAAFQSDRRTAPARALGVAIRQAGGVPRFKLKTGTADMNVVGPVWQCPIVAYGPGDSRLDHTPDEHILIADYLRAIPILQTVLETAR